MSVVLQSESRIVRLLSLANKTYAESDGNASINFLPASVCKRDRLNEFSNVSITGRGFGEMLLPDDFASLEVPSMSYI